MDILYINRPTEAIQLLSKGPTTLYHAELLTPADGVLSLYDGGSLIVQWPVHSSRVGCYVDYWALAISNALGYTFVGTFTPPEMPPTPSWLWGITVAIASDSGIGIRWRDAANVMEATS